MNVITRHVKSPQGFWFCLFHDGETLGLEYQPKILGGVGGMAEVIDWTGKVSDRFTLLAQSHPDPILLAAIPSDGLDVDELIKWSVDHLRFGAHAGAVMDFIKTGECRLVVGFRYEFSDGSGLSGTLATSQDGCFLETPSGPVALTDDDLVMLAPCGPADPAEAGSELYGDNHQISPQDEDGVEK